MRKIFILFFLCIFTVVYSNSVTITGKCKGYKKSEGILSFNNNEFYCFLGKYENDKFKGSFKVIDGTFTIRLNSIDSCVTRCCLKFGRKKIYVSFFRGDSIHISFNYNKLDSTLRFTGRGANKCYYTNFLYHSDDSHDQKSWNLGKQYITKKISDLKMYNVQFPMEPDFYRIAYSSLLSEEYNILLIQILTFRDHNLNIDNINAEIRRIANQIGLNNKLILSNISYYSFISFYLDSYYDKPLGCKEKYFEASKYLGSEFLVFYKAYLIAHIIKFESRNKKELFKLTFDDYSKSSNNKELNELILNLAHKEKLL